MFNIGADSQGFAAYVFYELGGFLCVTRAGKALLYDCQHQTIHCSSADKEYVTSFAMRANEWHHVVVVTDALLSLALYCDGKSLLVFSQYHLNSATPHRSSSIAIAKS